MFFNTFMSFISDLRYALRRMRRSPGFTTVAIVVLALGIGVNTALFSIVSALFFKPLPVRAPEELVYVYSTNQDGQVMAVLDQDQFDFFKEQAAELVEFTSHNAAGVAMSVDGENVSTQGELVRSSYFDLLGVMPLFGRVLGPEEDDPANPELAVVISHDLWTRRFNADPAILGKRVDLDRRSFTVVGVMEQGFRGLSDFWTPSDFWANPHQVFPNLQFGEAPIGRLKPGVSFSQFRAFVDAKTPELQQMRLDQMSPAERTRFGDRIRRSKYSAFRANELRMPFHPQTQVVPRALLVAVTVVVGLVLVIASANIAGLLLARGVTRTAEVAVRRALGADGWRLLLKDGASMTAIGCLLGLVLAVLTHRLTGNLLPGVPSIDLISFLLVPPALGLVVLLACYLPARRAASADPSQILRTL